MNDELKKKSGTGCLTRGDVGNMISAIDLAVEYRELCIRSERPPIPRREWKPADREKIDEWFTDTRIFRSLWRRLVALENR
jgi:hypothetical protein